MHLHGLGRRLTWTALRGIACTQAQIPAKGANIPIQDQSAILEGSLWRAVPRFALPAAATSILEQLSSLIDVVMIGHFSGEGGELGMAAVGANTPIMSLVINLFVGIALGANVVIANAVGRARGAPLQELRLRPSARHSEKTAP